MLFCKRLDVLKAKDFGDGTRLYPWNTDETDTTPTTYRTFTPNGQESIGLESVIRCDWGINVDMLWISDRLFVKLLNQITVKAIVPYLPYTEHLVYTHSQQKAVSKYFTLKSFLLGMEYLCVTLCLMQP